ncbi:MAG TPA: DUF3662 and FHA domain-containing protein [Ktedonobacterales bacterium]|nr:DUF3662 and FHA domain-containing protein [Ktedonobacterales bacterium]
MSIFDKIESVVRGAVEAPFGWIFPTRLQPVELERRLLKAMESNLTVTADRRIAPNFYEVSLSRADYRQFSGMANTLGDHLSRSLIDTARDRGYLMTSPPLIRLVEADHISTGNMQVLATLRDPHAVGQGASNGAANGASSLDVTRAMTAEEAAEWARRQNALMQNGTGAAPVAQESIPVAWLTLYRPTRGQAMRIERPVIHIGRSADNDIVVNEKKVSRYHAQIRCEHGQFMVYDLGSTNGVKVNGVTAPRPVPLRNNDLVTVGSYEFVFQRR